MPEIPNNFYCTSMKALILNETRDKFLVCKKESGVWVLPGGKLDYGESPQAGLRREILEEMNIEVTHIADNPSYFITGQTLRTKTWVANVIYKTSLAHLNFSPSDECVEIRFINKDTAEDIFLFPTVATLLKQFNLEK
jgi:8-oxo-dGTP pyrophosphatase MutT (NUDIX family)